MNFKVQKELIGIVTVESSEWYKTYSSVFSTATDGSPFILPLTTGLNAMMMSLKRHIKISLFTLVY